MLQVLHYLAASPFYDATSNNATLTTQANYNPSLLKYVETREAFEGQLRTMQGLEFVVASEPSQVGGAWVIRKQSRRKRAGSEDEVTVLKTFFIIGETIYTAPTVGDVLGSRLLSTVTSLTRFLSTASSLPLFSPSSGYTYIPPVPKPPTSVSSSQLSQTSKENTPMPDALARGTKNPSAPKAPSPGSSFQEARSLAESLNSTLRYGSDYMDEHPLIGEPGSFILASTHGTTQAQARPQPRVQAPRKASAAAAPAPSTTSAPSASTGRKGSKSGDKSPTSPAAPGKPKRKKSKAPAVSPVTANPT